MSTLRNQNWFNAQMSRRYPLDDTATGTDDDTIKRLRDDIVVDLSLRFPSTAGQYAFLGGLTVTENLVTAVILGADSPTAASAFTPLAAVTLQKPVARHVYYNVEPLYPGVGGFIVFGDVAEDFSIRLATPQQGLIAPHVARPYDALPIPTMRKMGRIDGLTGLVRILAGPDIEIVREFVNVNDEEREALVIRLINALDGRSVLKDYIGPCGVRPESRNCLKEGVETVNGVRPDCNGNLNIIFNKLEATPYESCGADDAGVIINQSLGIDDVCGDGTVNRFPGEDYCIESSSMSASSAASVDSESLSSESEEPPQPTPSESSEAEVCVDLPFLEFFEPYQHLSWDVRAGGFVLVDSFDPYEPSSDSLPSFAQPPSSSSLHAGSAWQSTEGWQRNLAIFDDCGCDPAINHRVRTHLQLTNDSRSRINGGIVLNYHVEDPMTNPLLQYFMVFLNRVTNKIEIKRYNGNMTILEFTVSPGLPFSLGTWYELDVTAVEHPTVVGDVVISVSVRNLDNPGWPAVTTALQTSRYGTPSGKHGVVVDRAITTFGFWSLEDA